MKSLSKFIISILSMGVVSFGLVVASISFNSYAEQNIEQAIQGNNLTLAKSLINEQQNKSFWQARIALKEQRLDDAETLLEKVLEKQQNNPQYHYWFGLINLQQASNASIFSAASYAKKGKKHLNRTLDLAPEHLKALEALLQFALRAPVIVGGSVKKAHHYADRIGKINKVEGYYQKLLIYKFEKDEEQEKKYALSISNSQNSSNKAYLAAGFSLQKLEDYEFATIAFSKASNFEQSENTISDKKVALQAQYQIGKTAALAKSNIAQGIAALEGYRTKKLLKPLPSKEWAGYRLASLYWLQNNDKEAQDLLKEVIEKTDEKRLKHESKILLKQIENS